MLNAIADSTVLVSAFLRKEGVSAVLLRHAAGGVFALSLSQEIVTETETVLLEREHIRRRYPYSNEDVAAFCQTLRGSFPLLTDLPPLTGIARDPNDDMVLATARTARATYLITRDLALITPDLRRHHHGHARGLHGDPTGTREIEPMSTHPYAG